MDAWADAIQAATSLAADPHGLGGAVVRAAPGPVRERWLDALRTAMAPGRPWRRMPPGIADERLLGGLDLAATLSAGRPVAQAGLMAEADAGVVVVPMAERLSPGTAARLACALDTGSAAGRDARFGLVLLDEGTGDEAAPEALTDRLAFRIDLTGIGLRECGLPLPLVGKGGGGPEGSTEPGPDMARAIPGEPGIAGAAGRTAPPEAIDPVALLCAVAEAFGIASLRAPILAARVARALAGDGPVGEAAVIAAARLVLAPRATRLPAPPDAQAEQGGPEEAEPEQGEAERREAPPPADGAPADDPAQPRETDPADAVVLEAVRAAIPQNLLAALLAGGPRHAGGRSGRSGQPAAAARAGRPVGSRRGDPRRGRLDLLATLRAAAPWQRLRRTPDETRPIVIRPDDLHIKKLRQRSETTTVFCVDASGSAALERLAEAKGAVELLLAEAYVRRDRVALVAFRGSGAELVLPPTRSLTRAKRGLSGLPGGGGTPLAAGIDAALSVALGVRRGGGRPVVVLLTDGRANVARSGEGGRARAGAEAVQAARALRAAGLPALVIDTGARGEGARAVAEAMGARYLPLPKADAGLLSAAVRATG